MLVIIRIFAVLKKFWVIYVNFIIGENGLFCVQNLLQTLLEKPPVKQLLVIDAAVEGYSQFVLDLDPSVAVVVLPDDANSGMAALADALAPYNEIDSLHLLSHGGEDRFLSRGR